MNFNMLTGSLETTPKKIILPSTVEQLMEIWERKQEINLFFEPCPLPPPTGKIFYLNIKYRDIK